MQTARLLRRLGLGPPGSQRKVPFLEPLTLSCNCGPRNLEIQNTPHPPPIPVYQRAKMTSDTRCRTAGPLPQRLLGEAGKPLAC